MRAFLILLKRGVADCVWPLLLGFYINYHVLTEVNKGIFGTHCILCMMIKNSLLINSFSQNYQRLLWWTEQYNCLWKHWRFNCKSSSILWQWNTNKLKNMDTWKEIRSLDEPIFYNWFWLSSNLWNSSYTEWSFVWKVSHPIFLHRCAKVSRSWRNFVWLYLFHTKRWHSI